MCMDGYKLYGEIVEQCNNNIELAYIKAKKKVVEHLSLKERTPEQSEEYFIWCKARDLLADDLAEEYIKEKGYERKSTEEGLCYFEEKRRDEERGTDQ